MQGVVAPAKVCVVSPHLDDAVFGCGRFLASHPGCMVLTVFAEPPSPDTPLTSFDARCGFASSSQAMQVRLAEDDRALASLDALPLRMTELDSQYAALPEPADLARRLWAMLKRTPWDAIVVPLGLFHCDHECVSDACMQLVQQYPGMMWIGYEDVLYRRRAGVLQRRLAALLSAGMLATPITLQGAAAASGGAVLSTRVAVPAHSVDASARKANAVACYASQLRCLGIAAGGDDGTPEGYWLLNLAGFGVDQEPDTVDHSSLA